VQVDPFKPTLKALGTRRLTLEYDEVLSIFAYKSNLRRFTTEEMFTLYENLLLGRAVQVDPGLTALGFSS